MNNGAVSALLQAKSSGKSKGTIRREQTIAEKKVSQNESSSQKKVSKKFKGKKRRAPSSMKHKELASNKRSGH